MSLFPQQTAPRVMAGIPAANAALFRQIRMNVMDPTALVVTSGGRRHLLIRDIEMERARQLPTVDEVHCPADFSPANGLSGDRETATAQALAEFLVRGGHQDVIADRTLPLIFAHCMQERGIRWQCDLDMGVTDRRRKDTHEQACLRKSQSVTEDAVRMACEVVARARVGDDGVLMHDGTVLTAERVRSAIDIFLLERGYLNQDSIVAGGPAGSDCHDRGSGPLRTGQPVIIDVFPQSRETRYFGDCTRTVVHGTIPAEVAKMHAAVVAAKAAAIRVCRAGVTGEEIHLAATSELTQRGYSLGLPTPDAPPSYCAMTHGTGHGVGLDVHEPPLLDFKGPPLLVGDAITIEPGLYCRQWGGIRVEDMVLVFEDGCENLDRLPEGLVWH